MAYLQYLPSNLHGTGKARDIDNLKEVQKSAT